MAKFWLLYAYCLYYLAGPALSSHFRGAVIRWRPASNPYNGSVEITHRISWRGSCTQATIDARTLLGSGSLVCRSGCSGAVGSMQYYCTDFSTTENWSAGERSYTYNASAVTSFEASFTGCCRISTLLPVGRSWEVRVKGNLTTRADTGSVNSSPISAIFPIVRLQQGCSHTIRIPVADVDGDDVRCRWAESSQEECSGVCGAFNGSILVGCNLQFPATGVAGLYAVALQIEDFATTTSTTPLSSVPLQFIVEVFTSTVSCASGTQPELVGVTRVDGSCVGVPSTYQERIVAKSGDSSVNIVDILTVSPLGLRKSSLIASTTPQEWYVDITWTPTSSQSGPNIFCYYALDSIGLSSPQSCITLLGAVQPPQLIRNSISAYSSQWSMQFDRQFRRPTSSRFIRIYDASNTQVVAIDVSTSSSVTYPTTTSGRTLTFSTTYSFTQRASYYVLLDPGVAVGTEFCGAESAAVHDPTILTLTIIVPTAPRNVTISGITQTSMMVTWEEPTMPNGILGPYNVTYNGTKSYDSTFSDTGSQLVSGRMVTLSGLIPSTNYSVVVMAINRAGFRNSSDPVVGTTQTAPPAPLDPLIEANQTGGPLTFTLIFPQVSSVNGPISHYQVIVVLLDPDTNVEDLQPPDMLFPNMDSLGTHSNINCATPGSLPIAYITSEFDANLFPSDSTFIVGDSSQPNDRSDITNGLLCYSATYAFFLRVYPEADIGATNSRVRRVPLSQRRYEVFSSSGYSTPTTTVVEPMDNTSAPAITTAYFQLRLKPVRECVTWVDEDRSRKFMDIVSAVVQSVQGDCSCNFTEINILNFEFSCRSIENTVIFRAEIIYTNFGEDPYTADDLVALVTTWAQSGTTSINVDSARLDIDSSCPTQLESFEAGDCESEITIGPAAGGMNVAAFGGAIGAVSVLLIAVSTVSVVIIVVQRTRNQKRFSPNNVYEDHELSKFHNPANGKSGPSSRDRVETDSNPAYGYYSSSRPEQKEEEKENHVYDNIRYDQPGH